MRSQASAQRTSESAAAVPRTRTTDVLHDLLRALNLSPRQFRAAFPNVAQLLHTLADPTRNSRLGFSPVRPARRSAAKGC